jgi:outer membrane protein assembly factor BamB
MTDEMKSTESAEPITVEREYVFPGVERVHGVTHDGRWVWFATDGRLVAFDPESGEQMRSLELAADAGTAFDGRHLFQIAQGRILQVDPGTGRVLSSIPAPSSSGQSSGLAWAEGKLWVGEYRSRKIHQVDPKTGAVLRTIESDRFVTGVTWADGELWHATWDETANESELRQVDPESGAVLARRVLPQGVSVSGLESDGAGTLYCGGGSSGKVRAVQRPKRPAASGSRRR